MPDTEALVVCAWERAGRATRRRATRAIRHPHPKRAGNRIDPPYAHVLEPVPPRSATRSGEPTTFRPTASWNRFQKTAALYHRHPTLSIEWTAKRAIGGG